MSRQEEIKEGVAIKLWLNFGENICAQCGSWKLCCHKQIFLDSADYILSYLHSQGVVLKVDRKLPELLQKRGAHQEFAERDLKRRLDKAGYAVVESLISPVVPEHRK